MTSSNPKITSISKNAINFGASAQNSAQSGGCQAKMEDGRRCGETKNLQIIKEFQRMYESKMKLIDDAGAAGGDNCQAKIMLQQEWIKDLTEQNEMLVKVVEELEVEAAERVTLLEGKLEYTSQCACEVMESYRNFSINFLGDFQKMEHLQNDLNNLIELLKRVKHHGAWSYKGLTFHTINVEDLLEEEDIPTKECSDIFIINCKRDLDEDSSTNCKNDKLLKDRDKRVRDLEERMRRSHEIAERHDEAQKSIQQYAEIKKSMLDMRDALTAEVAEKHDTILCLRRDMLMLEEQCKKADQQTHFKDDIIKELRRELKQLKSQIDELDNVCHPCSHAIQEKYVHIIQTLQIGLRESIKGIAYKKKA